MNNKLTEQKLKDPVLKGAIRTFASILIALSGLILFADKVIFLELDNTYGFKSTKTFIWVFAQSFSPFLLVLGSLFRPFKISYSIPIYFYTIQMVWVFSPQYKFDDTLMQVYALGSAIAFMISVHFINRLISRYAQDRNDKLTYLEQALDLSIKIHDKKDK